MNNYERQLLTVDVSVLARMKNAAKCDTWCESQEPASHRVFERTSRPWYSWGHACPSAAARHERKKFASLFLLSFRSEEPIAPQGTEPNVAWPFELSIVPDIDGFGVILVCCLGLVSGWLVF